MTNTKDNLVREQQLARWVLDILSEDRTERGDNACALPLQAIGSDAGFRRYYRVQTPEGTLVAVDAPPELEDTESFITIAGIWCRDEIRVPNIVAADIARGFMLQEDFGDRHLLGQLSPETADTCYRQCFDMLRQIQQCPSDTLPDYDKAQQIKELKLYPEWFLSGLLGVNDNIPDLTGMFEILSIAFFQQPQGTVHRDFHSRNLMVLPDGELGVIDFQGALHGPLLYDLVSLLRDCYVSWPQEQVYSWLSQYVCQQPRLKKYDGQQLQTWFDLTGLQRHLKCLGIFSRLWLRDNKPEFLAYILPTFEQVLVICHKYPEFRGHADWLQQTVRPVLTEHLAKVQEGVDV